MTERASGPSPEQARQPGRAHPEPHPFAIMSARPNHAPTCWATPDNGAESSMNIIYYANKIGNI